MRIAHFTRYLHAPGGITNYLTALVEHQQKVDHQVTVFTDDRDSGSSEHLNSKFVDNEQALFDICRNQSIDIIHYHTHPVCEPPSDISCIYTIHDHAPYCLSAGLFLKNSVKPCPITFNYWGCLKGHVLEHCGSVRPARILQNFSRLKIFNAIAANNILICVGNFQKDRMLKSGFNLKQIEVIPNFTDIEYPVTEMPKNPIPKFLFIGRLEVSKGPYWLLRAFSTLSTPATLNIAGDGSELEALRRLAVELKIADRVNFLGWVGRAQKIDLLQKARALIVPSIWPEPFGIVVAEAAAMSRPVIASSSGELPYLIKDRENGLIVEAGNIMALSTAIEALAADIDFSQNLGMHNYQAYKRYFRLETHVDSLECIYKKSIDEMKRRTNPSHHMLPNRS